jgi:integral membrane sensor domain MASE1
MPASLSLQHDHQTHYAQHDLLQPWVFAQQNCNVSDEGNETDDASDNIFFTVQEGLPGGVEFGVVCEVVVALCKEPEGCFAAAALAWWLSTAFKFLWRPATILPLSPSRYIVTTRKCRLTLLHIS